jgi:hypothetical protein
MKSKTVLPNKEFFLELIALLEQGKEVSLLVKGTSMKPFLDGETEVFLKEQANYKKGDICLFKYQDNYLLHRLLKVSGNEYCFRGDNAYRKEIVTKEDIYAKVEYYKKNEKDYHPWSFIIRFARLFHRGYLMVKLLVRKILRRK